MEPGTYCCREAYLELSQTTTMELFCDKEKQRKTLLCCRSELSQGHFSANFLEY